MALPRRGTRKIEVDGHSLRWMARPASGGFRLVAERHHDPGQKVVITLSHKAFGSAPAIVSPEIVRQCIVHALARGFDPEQPSGQVDLTVTKGMLQPGRVDQEALTPRPVGRPRKRAAGEKRRPVYVSLEKVDRARLEAAAQAAGVPIGTLARAWLLERLEREDTVE